MSAPRGFVLVNALILVGALAAAAMVLLIRAEMSIERQSARQTVAQGDAYLDAFEALAITVLDNDLSGGLDHRGEAWAQSLRAADLDRGEVSGRIEDLQGRFNVNWLAVPEDIQAQQAFDRLLAVRGLPMTLGPAIRDFLSPGGPADPAAYAAAEPNSRPRGGPVRDTGQLHAIPALSPELFDRLEPLISALPSDTRLNVNTAPPDILAAWLPGVTAETARTLVAQRDRTPFRSVDEFILSLPAAAAADADDSRLAVTSDWFLARGRARVDGRVFRRRSLLVRLPLPVGALVDYRLPDG